MIKKLSTLPCTLEKNGTLSINLKDGNILKISPTEILTIANQICELQNKNETKYSTEINSLKIPTNVTKKIKEKLNENQ